MLMAEISPAPTRRAGFPASTARLPGGCPTQPPADHLRESLSWTAAVSTAFLCVGILGFFTRPMSPVVAAAPMEEPVPVLFEPPAEPASPLEALSGEAPAESEATPVAVPQIVQVAPANALVAFSVPTVGVVVPARLAQAPPARPLEPSKTLAPDGTVSLFTGVGSSGNFPAFRTYPAEARRRGVEGNLEVLVEVGPDGVPVKVATFESSGSLLLDHPAVEWVRTHYRWPEGSFRRFRIPFEFRLRK
jgi:periplasmic protein TonB